MPFEKGNTHGTGRPKGSKDKKTAEARELFLNTLEGQVENIEDAFQKVLEKSPEKYLDLLSKYMQYFIPKKTEQDIKAEVSGTFDFNEAIKRLRGDQQ